MQIEVAAGRPIHYITWGLAVAAVASNLAVRRLRQMPDGPRCNRLLEDIELRDLVQAKLECSPRTDRRLGAPLLPGQAGPAWLSRDDLPGTSIGQGEDCESKIRLNRTSCFQGNP